MKEQEELLEIATKFLKQGGRLIYVTCSLLREENEDRIASFLARQDAFVAIGADELAAAAGLAELGRFASRLGPGLRLTPATAGTDGFFIAGLRRL